MSCLRRFNSREEENPCPLGRNLFKSPDTAIDEQHERDVETAGEVKIVDEMQ